MPVVPTLDTPRVRRAALPGPRASASDFAGPAQQLQQVGKAIDAVADAAATYATIDATNAVTAARDQIDTLRQQHLMREGVNARGAADAFAADYDEVVRKQGQGLNGVARTVFDQMMQKARGPYVGALRDHEQAQTRKAFDDAQGALRTTLANDAAANYTRPDLLATSLRQGEVSLEAQAVQHGWDAPTKQAELEKWRTGFHKQVLGAAIDAAPEYARAYYEQHKDQIAGSERDNIEKALRTAGTREAAQTFADEAMAGKMTEAEALAAARQKFSGEQEVLAVAEIKTRFDERAAAKKQTEDALVNQAWGYRLQNKPIPNTVLAGLPAKVQADLLADMERATETDWGVYGELVAMPPADLANVNLPSYFGSLADAERKELLKKQAAYKNGNDDEKLDAVTQQQQLAQVHNQLLMSKEEIGRFDKVATTAINQEQVVKGRKLDQKERQAVLDRLLTSGEVEGRVWNSSRRLYQVQPGENFLPSSEERAKIVAALERAGRPVTEEAVLDLFRRKAAGQ